jgi:mannitol-1-phosphate/altronate dehydrogenase
MCRFADSQEQSYPSLWPGHKDSLVVEDYDFLPLDADRCSCGPFTSVFSLVPHGEFACWEDIKLFMHNGMHAFVSYHAFLEGVKSLPDTPSWIRQAARNVVLKEVVPAIVRTHAGVDPDRIEQYGLQLLERFFNPFFNDSVERGVRGIEEKLAPGERLLGGCEYIRRAGIEPRGYAQAVEAAREVLSRSQAGKG